VEVNNFSYKINSTSFKIKAIEQLIQQGFDKVTADGNAAERVKYAAAGVWKADETQDNMEQSYFVGNSSSGNWNVECQKYE
jgi:hypothetical protein